LEKTLKEQEAKEKIEVIYHGDDSSIVPHRSTPNICYSWRENLEEPSNKEVLPFVKMEKV
jgi:hypothetical protein